MARGRLLKTKVRETKKLTAARMEAIRKFFKKHPQEWFSHQFPTLMNNMEKITEFAAVLGMTVMVKMAIDSSEILLAEVEKLKAKAQPWIYFAPLVAPFAAPYLTPLMLPAAREETKFNLPDWSEWLISFTLAYIIVHHFGDIMHSLGGGISAVKSLVSSLLLGGVA